MPFQRISQMGYIRELFCQWRLWQYPEQLNELALTRVAGEPGSAQVQHLR